MRLSQNKTVFFSVGLHGAGGAGGRTGSGGGACEQHAGVQFVTVLRRREQRPHTVEP